MEKKTMYQRFIKKGDNKMTSKYRPVSLASVVSKTKEQILRYHVSNEKIYI